jgi:hypothetical protein
VGSRPKVKNTDLAYIAGFLDGDGSLMLQIKKRSDVKNKRRFMLTICFCQDKRNDKVLFWIRKKLGIGYISKRKDKITELRINGYETVGKILKMLSPYLKVKRKQAEILIKCSHILRKKINQEHLKKLAKYIHQLQSINYTTRKKKSLKEIYSALGLTL